MKENEIAKKLYIKIDFSMRKSKIRNYQLAEKIGISMQYMSDLLLALKDGKLIHLKYLLKIQEILGEAFIFFDF